MQSVEIVMPDRIRHLRFRLTDLRDLQRRSGDLTLLQIADRLQALDVSVILTAYWIGLRHEDSRIMQDQVDGLLQKRMDAGETMLDLVKPLVEAFTEHAGLVRARQDDEGKASAVTASA